MCANSMSWTRCQYGQIPLRDVQTSEYPPAPPSEGHTAEGFVNKLVLVQVLVVVVVGVGVEVGVGVGVGAGAGAEE